MEITLPQSIFSIIQHTTNQITYFNTTRGGRGIATLPPLPESAPVYIYIQSMSHTYTHRIQIVCIIILVP